MGHLQSDHEEADAKIILHAVDARRSLVQRKRLHYPHLMPLQEPITLVASQGRERYLVRKHF